MAKKPTSKKEFYLKQNQRIHIQNETLKRHTEQAENLFVSDQGALAPEAIEGASDWVLQLQEARGSLKKSRSKRRRRAKAMFR